MWCVASHVYGNDVGTEGDGDAVNMEWLRHVSVTVHAHCPYMYPQEHHAQLSLSLFLNNMKEACHTYLTNKVEVVVVYASMQCHP